MKGYRRNSSNTERAVELILADSSMKGYRRNSSNSAPYWS